MYVNFVKMKTLNKSRVLRGMTKFVLLELEKQGEDPQTLDEVAALLQLMVGKGFKVRSDFLKNALLTQKSMLTVCSDGTVTWKERKWGKK